MRDLDVSQKTAMIKSRLLRKTPIFVWKKASSVTWVHLIAVKVGAALAAADAGEGGDGVSVAVTITDEAKQHR